MGKPKPPTCRRCWFSGLEPMDDTPHGRMRWVCSIISAPIEKTACAAFQPSREPMFGRQDVLAAILARRAALAGTVA